MPATAASEQLNVVVNWSEELRHRVTAEAFGRSTSKSDWNFLRATAAWSNYKGLVVICSFVAESWRRTIIPEDRPFYHYEEHLGSLVDILCWIARHIDDVRQLPRLQRADSTLQAQ